MKNKTILLLIIPFFTLIYSLSLRYSQGPFYYNTGYDPSYVYLISSLNIAQFSSPHHVDHPGTPVQIIGALIIKSAHFLHRNSSAITNDISKDVFNDPEYYIRIIHEVFLIFNILVLIFCGIFLYRITENLILSILIQLGVFSSYTTSVELTSFSPEIFLIPVCIVFITLAFLYTYQERKNIIIYILLFSIICGIAIATKLTFIPLIIVPFILITGVSRKILFLLFTLLFFLIFILPAISNYNYFINWINNLFISDGLYGYGNKTILNTDTFFENLINIFQTELIFSVSFILMAIVIPFTFLNRKKYFPEGQFPGQYKLLSAIFLTSFIQIMIVAKHYAPRYMIPSLILTLPVIYLSLMVISDSLKLRIFGLNKIKINGIFIILIFLVMLISSYHFIKKFKDYSFIKEQIIHLNKVAGNYLIDGSESIIISEYGTSRKEYGLAFAVFYAGEMSDKYQKLLAEIYPEIFYFDFSNNRIYSYRKESIADMINKDKKILFLNKFTDSVQKLKDDLLKNYSAEVTKLNTLYSVSSGETLYEVILK